MMKAMAAHAPAPASPLVNIERIRASQADRVARSLAAWESSKEQLRAAIALAETREREHRETTADVEAKLAALELVASLAVESPREAIAPAMPAIVRRSRPLFTRSNLSIL